MAKKIDDFHKNYYFLSNYYRHEMVYEGDKYSTSEHAFQAAKCTNRADKERIIEAKTPGLAKRIGGTIPLRSDWEEIKDSIMENVLKAKFDDERMREFLNDTKGYELIEGNYWHDQYWGTCTCSRHHNTPGKNVLGILLMKIRDAQ